MGLEGCDGRVCRSVITRRIDDRFRLEQIWPTVAIETCEWVQERITKVTSVAVNK